LKDDIPDGRGGFRLSRMDRAKTRAQGFGHEAAIGDAQSDHRGNMGIEPEAGSDHFADDQGKHEIDPDQQHIFRRVAAELGITGGDPFDHSTSAELRHRHDRGRHHGEDGAFHEDRQVLDQTLEENHAVLPEQARIQHLPKR